MRKIYYFTTALFCCIVWTTEGVAQLPLEAHGVWDRGFSHSPVDYPFIKGLTFNKKWKDIEKAPNIFDWSELDAAIRKAYDLQTFLYLKINVGPDSPEWIYSNGVPRILTEESRVSEKWPSFPYYLDLDYERYYHRLIEKFAERIHGYPDEMQRCVAFIQVQTGSTGDEAAYKTRVKDPEYKLDPRSLEWKNFRLSAFEKFNEAFQKAPGEMKIPLLFNAVGGDDYGEEWEWVLQHIKGGIGIKEGALSRGHHLKKEREVYEKWISYLVNPTGQRLFRRSEMDQTWRRTWYQLNPNLNFYWGAINALNAGQSVWDITSRAIDASQEEGFDQAFYFFNKYAGQIYPATSTDAFCALHKGLDASDTEAYPESAYGKAVPRNADRMIAICEQYVRYGARVDDVDALRMGQVAQRRSQKGFNDVGWAIWPENYERFLHQIDADQTSVPLWRIGGEISETSSIYSRFARGFEHISGKDEMYFHLHDAFIQSDKPKTVSIRIVWYDQVPGSTWELVYDAGKDEMNTALKVTGSGDKVWKEQIVIVKDAVLQRNGLRGSDFALRNTDEKDDVFSMIEIHRDLPNSK